MTVLFWILAVLSIPVGFYMSVVCYFMQGLGLSGSIIGDILAILGMLSLVVSILCAVLGIIKLRKGNAKRAVVWALAGFIYVGAIFGGFAIADAIDTAQLDKRMAEYEKQLYGENWNDPPAIDGIPKLYQEVLNKFYVVVRDRWSAEQLMDLGAESMSMYYGDAPLDNIGFALMDVNGDGIIEVLIGTTHPLEEGGTGVFCLYNNPKDPSVSLYCVENGVYYLHTGEAAGTHYAEISGEEAFWLLEDEADSDTVGVRYREGRLDPAGRLTLELIPFSQYK